MQLLPKSFDPSSFDQFPFTLQLLPLAFDLSCVFPVAVQILVVRTYDCIKRLREALAATRSTVPSMLALSMVQVGARAGPAREPWG